MGGKPYQITQGIEDPVLRKITPSEFVWIFIIVIGTCTYTNN